MKKLIFIFLITFFVVSCSKQDEPLVQNPSSDNASKIEVMKEFSQLLGRTLTKDSNREYLVGLIHDRNDNSEAISVNALFGKNVDATEARLLSKSRTSSTRKVQANNFRTSIANEVNNNIDKYPILKSSIKKINKTAALSAKTSADIYDELADYFVAQNLDVYFPYEENFELDSVKLLTITWDPLNEQLTNSGYTTIIDEATSKSSNARTIIRNLTPIENISDDYAYKNPTLIVRPAAPVNGFVINSVPISSTPNATPMPPSWAFQGWQGFLTFNVDHTKILEADVLKVSIPKIRLKEHLATLFTPTTITIIRSSANLVTDSGNFLVFPLTSDSKHLVTKMDIKRKDARNKNWIEVNILWDDDWNMSEAEHNLTWASHHTFRGSLTATGNVKLGYDVEKKKVTFEPKIDVAFSVKVGNNCRLRYNNNVSRRAILTQVVGDTGAGTIADNGVDYSVRTADVMEYYFKPYLTKIAQ